MNDKPKYSLIELIAIVIVIVFLYTFAVKPKPSRRYICKRCGAKGRHSSRNRYKEPICPACTKL